MPIYRLDKAIAALPVGGTHIINIPAGELIEMDDSVAHGGLAIIFWAGTRLTVFMPDLVRTANWDKSA
jgi:hypothetical protein